MKLRELAYLADENLDPDVTAHLRSLGWDVKTLAELGLLGSSDADVLRAAFSASRVVLTHDGDFGRLAFAAGEPCFGVVRLRPGHIRAEFTIATLDALLRKDPDVQPPFILVAHRQEKSVTIKLRRFGEFRRPKPGSEG